MAILFNPKLDFKINSIHKDKNGRVIIISIVLEDNTFVIANVYSPNDQNAQVRFYKNVFSLLEPFANDQIHLIKYGINESELSLYYLLTFVVTHETKLSIFQFKILHNILPTNLHLYRMNIRDSSSCPICNDCT